MWTYSSRAQTIISTCHYHISTVMQAITLQASPGRPVMVSWMMLCQPAECWLPLEVAAIYVPDMSLNELGNKESPEIACLIGLCELVIDRLLYRLLLLYAPGAAGCQRDLSLAHSQSLWMHGPTLPMHAQEQRLERVM